MKQKLKHFDLPPYRPPVRKKLQQNLKHSKSEGDFLFSDDPFFTIKKLYYQFTGKKVTLATPHTKKRQCVEGTAYFFDQHLKILMRNRWWSPVVNYFTKLYYRTNRIGFFEFKTTSKERHQELAQNL